MKKVEHEFCMRHFKVSIAVLLALIVIVVDLDHMGTAVAKAGPSDRPCRGT